MAAIPISPVCKINPVLFDRGTIIARAFSDSKRLMVARDSVRKNGLIIELSRRDRQETVPLCIRTRSRFAIDAQLIAIRLTFSR